MSISSLNNMDKDLLRKRLVDGQRSGSDGTSSSSPNTSSSVLFNNGPSSPKGFNFSPKSSLLSAGGSYGGSALNLNPETHFDQIIQKAEEHLAEVRSAILNLKNSKASETDLIDTESQIDKTLSEVTRIASQLQKYVEETSTRRTFDSAISPRVVSAIKYRETAVNGLLRAIRDVRKNMQIACSERERKDLLNDWDPFSRTSRGNRDAEELISDSTERLLNSKRILLETIQSSSGTLTSLATSSQSIQGNDEELHTQSYMVSSARSLLTKYGRRASTDKVLIWLGFIFFGFCVFVVVYRRLF